MAYRLTDTDPARIDRLTFTLFGEDGTAYAFADGRPALPTGEVLPGEDWPPDGLCTPLGCRARVVRRAVRRRHRPRAGRPGPPAAAAVGRPDRGRQRADLAAGVLGFETAGGFGDTVWIDR